MVFLRVDFDDVASKADMLELRKLGAETTRTIETKAGSSLVVRTEDFADFWRAFRHTPLHKRTHVLLVGRDAESLR